jgi:exodeoxyribonuclease-3
MSHVRLVSWNVNGIRAAEKKGFLDWLAATDADVVAVQETKAQPDQLTDTLLNPPGYVSAWHSAEKKGYSGVVTYSKLPAETHIEGVGDPRFDVNGRALISDFGRFVLFNTYFPNGGRGPDWVAHKLDFYRHYLSLISSYVAAGRSAIVCGDLNTAYAEIDLALPKQNQKISGFLPEEREALGEYYAAGLIDSFRQIHPEEVKYSWWDQRSGARARNLGWRIDAFLISRDLVDKIVEADIHMEQEGSDHCPVSLVLNL